MIELDDITAAAERIAGHVIRTPSVSSPGLSESLGVPVAAKLELLQHTARSRRGEPRPGCWP